MKTKTPTPRAPGACPPPSWEQRGGPAIPVLYRLWPQDPAGHRYRITLTVAEPAADGQRLSLPAWIPGSYLIRDFSRQIESLTAYSGARRVTVNKLDNHTWQAAPCDGRCASNTRSMPGTCRCAARTWTKPTVSSTAPACSCACTARNSCPAWSTCAARHRGLDGAHQPAGSARPAWRGPPPRLRAVPGARLRRADRPPGRDGHAAGRQLHRPRRRT